MSSGDTQSHETIACLRALLHQAEAGQLIGVAWVSMYQRREWDYHTCGEAHRNPVWCLGMLHAFTAHLTDQINDV